tara:strand:- start:152 stop:496 length:345 start_codon:yes stop_codon:yes gene_type:complete
LIFFGKLLTPFRYPRRKDLKEGGIIMATEKCKGCNGDFSTEWPPETIGSSAIKPDPDATEYWYVCPHCKGKNFVNRDDENNVTIERFEEGVETVYTDKSDGDAFSPVNPTGKGS